jgi:hypothetical protein
MTPARSLEILRAAAVLALVALASIAWSLLDPRPVAVILAMSLGQVLGTLSFAGFLLVVAADLLRARRALREGRRRLP